MKTKFIISSLLVFFLFVYLFLSGSAYETNVESGVTTVTDPSVYTAGAGDSFIISAFNSGYDVNYEYDSLHFNLWHLYGHGKDTDATGRHIPPGWQGTWWAPADSLTADINVYRREVQNTLDDIAGNNMKALLTRPKLEWLRYGQRSDYQCEYVSPVPGAANDLWFYAFNSDTPGRNYTGESRTDSGAGVKRCLVSADEAGWVVDRLRANSEQGLPYGDKSAFGDNECQWLIKPRIRIDSAWANNPANFNNPVCSITVKNQDGNTFKNIILRARHFKADQLTQYKGNYLEEYFFQQNDSNLTYKGKWGTGYLYEARGTNSGDSWDKADIQVYWYGNCDMYIDYVRVDNDIADQLFKGQNEDWIEWEAKEIACYHSGSTAYRYYLELFEFNNLPCINYVFRKLDSITYSQCGKHISLIATFTPHLFAGHVPWRDRLTVWNEVMLKKYLLDKVNAQEVMIAPYPFTSQYNYPERYPYNTWSKIPNTLPRYDTLGVLAEAVSPANYEAWLQAYLDSIPYSFESSYSGTEPRWTIEKDPGFFRYMLQFGDAISKETGLPWLLHTSAHSWYLGAGSNASSYRSGIQARSVITGEVQREPTNEELDLVANVALTYGAKGLMWFEMASRDTMGQEFYSRGILNPYWEGGNNNNPPRYINAYGQQKWNKLKEITRRMKSWEPYIMSFDNIHRHSYIYRLDDEREACRQNEYFSSIASYYRGNSYNNCMQDNPGFPPYDGLIYDCAEETYIQAATFEKTQVDGNNYFMIVNRRCSPLDPVNHNDGERYIRVHFDSDHAELNGSNNWKVTDVVSGWDTVFNKLNSAHVVNLGWFNPGEGRLYKMIPVPKSGGVLAGDEVITGESFTCEDTIFSNGYNISIGAGTNMKFTDSSCIVMNGGVFTMGNQQVSGPQNITFDAESGSTWRGHRFTGTEVHIYGASLTGLANDSVYALNLIDCPVVDIRNTSFNTSGSLKGAINAVYYANEESATVNFYTGGNTFTATGSTIPTINVSSFAGMTTPLILENNTFTNGNTAIFLSGVIGGAIKNNNISENYTGISLLSSYIDVSGNTISSNVNGSTGIFAAGGSEVKMNSAGSKQLGGMNNISNEGTGTNNIKVEGSYFLTDEGQNIFNISDISTSYHLYGYFPQFISIPYDETMNCFKISGSSTNTTYNLVTDGYQGSQISFNFNPFLTGCDPEQGENMMVLDLGDGINDTIYSNGSGSGGSESSIENKNQKRVYVQNVNTAYDSICMLMRSRNYSAARTKCLEMIGNYPDSIQSLNALAKLYLSSVSSNANITNLKVFYENLILNHPNNTSLVKRANYYILKCKVRLHEYTSALAGFQQIINENPYSYEGLVARWDYMATSLLVPGGGGEPMNADFGFSIADLKAEDLGAEDREGNPKSEFRDPNSSDDKSPFTKEQRIDIRKSINTAIENDKNDNDRKIRILETKSDQGDINAIKELAQVKALKQVVKTEKPRSITEHIKLVSEDIQKVFGNVTGGKGKDMSNIPTVYRLSQNYPNPFNPVTKINYDLPKDAKVNIVIYDILGREVKRLVNNELKTAGTYIIDFNASNYASGVYFYRIEAEEPGGNKFVDSKKMVLLK